MQQTYAYIHGRRHALARLGCAKYAGLSAQTLEALGHGAPAHAVEDWSVSMMPQEAGELIGTWNRNKYLDSLEQLTEARAQGRQATDAMNQEFTTPFLPESVPSRATSTTEGTYNARAPKRPGAAAPQAAAPQAAAPQAAAPQAAAPQAAAPQAAAPQAAAPQAAAPQAAAPQAAAPQAAAPAKPPTNYTPAILAGTAGTALGIGGVEAYDHSGSN